MLSQARWAAVGHGRSPARLPRALRFAQRIWFPRSRPRRATRAQGLPPPDPPHRESATRTRASPVMPRARRPGSATCCSRSLGDHCEGRFFVPQNYCHRAFSEAGWDRSTVHRVVRLQKVRVSEMRPPCALS